MQQLCDPISNFFLDQNSFPNRRVKNLNLSDKAIKFIEAKNFGYLATVMSDGSPQVSHVWIDHEGNELILVNTAIGRLKQRNAKRNPKVAIAIADAVNQYDMITIRGSVVEQTSKDADEHIDKLAKKYLGKDKYPYRSPMEKRIVLKIKPDRISD